MGIVERDNVDLMFKKEICSSEEFQTLAGMGKRCKYNFVLLQRSKGEIVIAMFLKEITKSSSLVFDERKIATFSAWGILNNGVWREHLLHIKTIYV